MRQGIICLFIFCAAIVFAGGIADDSEQNPAVIVSAEVSLRTRALEYYIRAMMQKNPAQQLPDLLKSLELDPEAQMPLQALVQIHRTQPPQLQIQTAEGVLKIAEQHPENHGLNVTAIQMAQSLSPELNKRSQKAAANSLKNSNKNADPDLMAVLLGIHIQDLMEQGKHPEAYAALQKNIEGQKKTDPILYEWLGIICSNAIPKASAERRWFGLCASDREIWETRRQDAVEQVRQTDAGLPDFQSLKRRVKFYTGQRCTADALRLAEEAVRRFSGNTDAAFLRVVTLLLTHRYQEAFGHAKELVKVSPQSPECLRILAESALRTGNYEAALDAGRKHLALKPQDESLRFFTAAALILMDRFKEAETEIALVKDRPFRISLENVLASRTRDWSKVLAGIRKQQRSPDHKDDAEIYYTLLVIAEQTRDVKLLEESWQKLEKAGLLKEPEHANSVGYVATVLNHRLEEAGNLIRLALDKEPENEAYIDSLAWYHYQKGEYAKAWECIRKALEQMEYKANPPGTIFDHAGDIALKLGKKELALEYYRQALGDYLATDLDIQAVQKKIHRLTAENN